MISLLGTKKPPLIKLQLCTTGVGYIQTGRVEGGENTAGALLSSFSSSTPPTARMTCDQTEHTLVGLWQITNKEFQERCLPSLSDSCRTMKSKNNFKDNNKGNDKTQWQRQRQMKMTIYKMRMFLYTLPYAGKYSKYVVSKITAINKQNKMSDMKYTQTNNSFIYFSIVISSLCTLSHVEP